jgi:hypothetical protein
MTEFNPAKTKAAWNKAVDAHAANGGAKSQLRPKIEKIGPRRKFEGQEDYRTLRYANGVEFVIDESGIASIVHSYTFLVGLLTGNFNLIALPYWMDVEAPAGVARGISSKALPAGVSIFITLGINAFLSLVKSKKTKAAVHDLAEDVHEGVVSGYGREFCDAEQE